MATTSSTPVELIPYPQHSSRATPADAEILTSDANEPSNGDEGFSLPPTDGGKDAWLCLFSCFMLEALIWGTCCLCPTQFTTSDSRPGFPSCYGVFQEYYATSDEFAGSSSIAVVGTCAMVLIPTRGNDVLS